MWQNESSNGRNAKKPAQPTAEKRLPESLVVGILEK